ncbi:MAG: deoxynucleoside kinase [Clostridia bacterium]|nr:deoxynucleoside kinase [Clostridia bacterium]MBR5991289.1 deoxynucleoside kinase [Clostridia bacterium]MBR6479373.1 deoxynucleoside kinase [Clostridia bacterium]MBR6512267.1 deoxynucleoside kinase [Clostridia bacterium]
MMGKLIVIEGLDGSGKSTQIKLVREFFEARGEEVHQIKLPDYESDSSALVRMYLGGEFGTSPTDVNAYAASSFYAVDRYANFVTKWKDDYEAGKIILADRYATSNAAHQMTKLDRDSWDDYLAWLEDFEYCKIGIPKPSLVVYLDMPVEISQKLMTSRYKGDEAKKDVHEANVAYLLACREAGMYAAEKLGWSIVKCYEGDEPRPIADIAKDIERYLCSM